GRERRGDTEAFVSRGGIDVFVTWDLAYVRQIVGRRRSKAGPDADRLQALQPGHVAKCSRSHAIQHSRVNAIVLTVKPPRRAKQDLPGAAWLDVERDRGGSCAVGRLQIGQFDKLVSREIRIALGDDEMAFSFSYL